MNLVMNSAGEFIELQGTGEEATFSEAQLAELLALGKIGHPRIARGAAGGAGVKVSGGRGVRCRVSMIRRAAFKSKSLWKISIATTPEAEDAVAELLQAGLARPAASYTDVETGRTTVTRLFARQPDRPGRLRAPLASGIGADQTLRLKHRPRRNLLSQIRPENWAESWKRHFKPIEIGPALLIKPSWSRRRPRKGKASSSSTRD